MVICENCGHHNRPKKEVRQFDRNALYRVWLGIKDRCYNVEDKSFKSYGGRGITMCDEWKNSFDSFKDWALDNGWKKGLHTDRKDNYSGYTPENCRFVSPAENYRNRRDNAFVEYKGVKYTVSELAREKKIFLKTLWDRLYKHKWDVKKAAETPTRKFTKSKKWLDGCERKRKKLIVKGATVNT